MKNPLDAPLGATDRSLLAAAVQEASRQPEVKPSAKAAPGRHAEIPGKASLTAAIRHLTPTHHRVLGFAYLEAEGVPLDILDDVYRQRLARYSVATLQFLLENKLATSEHLIANVPDLPSVKDGSRQLSVARWRAILASIPPAT